MRTRLLLAFVFVGAVASVPLFPQAAGQKSAPQAAKSTSAAMTNADVVNMVAAGLSEQIVLAAIRDAKARTFDVSPSGLIGLKKAGVSDAVIAAMMNREAPAVNGAPPTESKSSPPAPATVPPSASATSSEAGVPPMVASEAGLYYISDEGLVRIEAKTPYQTRTGSKFVSALTLGIKPARINAMLMGLRSDLQVTSAPKFYLHVWQVLGESESIGEYYLVKFTVKESASRREIEIGSSNFAKFQQGFPEKDLFQMDVARQVKDIYLIAPKSALGGGEYGILQLPQGSAPSPVPKKIFDFGVR